MFNEIDILLNPRRRVMRRAGRAAATRPAGFGEAPQASFEDMSPALADERIRTVLEAARRLGMLEGKTARISGRVSPTLLDRAKKRAGLMSDTDLIEFALANLALDDDFDAVFRRARGTVDPDLPLGY